MTQDKINHIAIAASAGSGKTFQLAHRYIQLLAGGVPPDRIIALTFSRKAAGEIFESIVRYLCEAISSPEHAQQMGRRIERTGSSQGDFLGLLRDLLDNSHRLHIGTLDSFIVGIVSTFPMELGISSDFQVLDNDGAEAREAREEILRTIFDHHHVDRSTQREFLQAFKQATFGQEEKGPERNLATIIGKYRNRYQILPLRDLWGNENAVWLDGSPWLVSLADVNDAASELETSLLGDKLSESVMGRWHTFINAAVQFRPSSPWTRDIEYLFEKLIHRLNELRKGSASIPINRIACELSSRQCELALVLVSHVMKTELNTALNKTRGIYQILDQYEQFYDVMIHRRGKLTFDDAQYLLTEANRYSGGALLSRMSNEDARLYIDYRIDCKLDHWLLDEFQDTSSLQWEVLRNLADEILQDVSGQRSFFYVGDVKQAIYGWRGGNAQLFGKILEQYSGHIALKPLSTSFRSCESVIDTVNAVFGDLPEDILPKNTIKEWKKTWKDHKSQQGVVPKHGHVALLEPPCNKEGAKPTARDRYQLVAHLLNEINPLARGLSVGILVRTNETGKRIVDFLRRTCSGMNIVHEGKATIKDNCVVSVFLSLLRLAAHPGDIFAWRHLEMSPLCRYFAREQLSRDNLSLVLLREIQTFGFQAFIRNWDARLQGMHPLDDFGKSMLRNLVDAAGEFDESGNRDCDAFCRFVESYKVDELAAANAVRVMTIHQSKGLGFDIVILPELHGRNLIGGGKIDFVIARSLDTNQPLWGLEMPRRLVASAAPVLSSQAQAYDEASCFDELCVLYVALTRARQALYMITSFPGRTAQVVTTDAFLKLQLVGDPKPVDGPRIRIDRNEFICLYEAGERDWYKNVSAARKSTSKAEQLELTKDFCKQPSLRRRFAHVLPARMARVRQTGALFFDRNTYDSQDFGSAIHELFEKVMWADSADIEGVIGQWKRNSSLAGDMKQRVIKQFRFALVCAEVQRALSRPKGNIELWRERPFEIIVDDQWVSGVFDRVTIVRDKSNHPLTATIVDYKSDIVADPAMLHNAAKLYRPQLTLYGKALSQILGIEPTQLRLKLLFTQSGKIYDL